ncbi:hypothetical protein HU200_046718 [Digitaria exilis]|uniref:DUF1618 domain-containing protein n=1 Tax=Digitaria exilis TaxID=1010633 RepID=A0A835EB14_9POAL|nr:hypothetical protein HU200_046718 [Digitaria exilis]
MRVPVLHSGDHALDTHAGCILFCDVFAKPNPTVSYLRLPLDEFPKTNNRSRACSWLYRCVSAVDDGNVMTLGMGHYVLMLDGVDKWGKETIGSVVWHKDWTVTSDELWSANPPELLPRSPR